jgi:hypothetical protein
MGQPALLVFISAKTASVSTCQRIPSYVLAPNPPAEPGRDIFFAHHLALISHGSSLDSLRIVGQFADSLK